jgi:conjugal transfer mating pair stabilization protein TraN
MKKNEKSLIKKKETRKVSIFYLLSLILLGFYFTGVSNAIDIKPTDFNSIFNNASSEQGKKNYVEGYVGTNIPERNINASNIDTATNEARKTNEVNKFIEESKVNQPQVNMSDLGNVINNYNKSVSDTSILNTNYSNCKNPIDYLTCYRVKNKTVPTKEYYTKTCNTKPIYKCAGYDFDKTFSNVFLNSPSYDNYRYYKKGYFTSSHSTNSLTITGHDLYCTRLTQDLIFYIKNKQTIDTFMLVNANYDDSLKLTLNGNVIYNGGCCGNQNINNNVAHLLVEGRNTLSIWYDEICTGGSFANIYFRINKGKCLSLVETTSETCNNTDIQGKCTLSSTTCTEGSSRRMIEGLPVTKSCWNTRKIYNCTKDNYHSVEDCDAMNLTNCQLWKQDVMDANSTRYIYKCEDKDNVLDNNNGCNQHVNTTPEPLPPTEDNTADLLKTATLLATANGSVETIDSNSLEILGGETKKCGYTTGAFETYATLVGVSIGVATGGSIESLKAALIKMYSAVVSGLSFSGGLTQDCCEQEISPYLELAHYQKCGNELMVKELVDAGKCVHVGTYCDDEVVLLLGKECMYKRKSYCCFPNKFSKILSRATREQGMKSWGSSTNPNCSGIRVDEMEKLDFNKIDFSEAFGDIKGGIDQDQINSWISDAMKQMK